MYTVEEFDDAKSKVLKYALYKKRTKSEIKEKFYSTIEQSLLNDVIDELEENGYINDSSYIEKAINEYKTLNNLSVKEVRYKLLTKGLNRDLIDEYIQKHLEELASFEIESACKLAIKKSRTMEEEEIKEFLYKKGYVEASVQEAIKEIEK